MRTKLKTEVLAEHIERRNLSQNGFAMKAGVSGPYMAQLLSGKRRPSGRVREKLLKATKMKFDELFVIESHSAQSPEQEAVS
jgi:transcriptional regulator with XRE-family HTH domain